MCHTGVQGSNSLEKHEAPPLWKLFVAQFGNIIILLLMAACIASFFMGEWVEGVAVLVIATLNAFITVYTEQSANDALSKLASISQPFTTALRDGEAQVSACSDHYWR